ncbi:WD domain protein [Talaromyces stipitatus ATCC 10500]|uniref:WD domain protein n=1 Tax=Talaromyces stipitatus (strain ATCC 10500 / CBS 375.48 / QM 6759 / NRRL 1006) TaxID=441959 RepID=B8MIH2_TALSN|nr:WD domain protein [Talaromyces stipitatus ATCC 10500]EED15064.1 WD domain protein [Talaromyces stipitatus ATCC 10500]
MSKVGAALGLRFHALAGDSELWKRRYFAKWVLPRARSVPQSKHLKLASTGTVYSPRVSKWLGHSHLATEGGNSIHWKTQYRLRHNWSKGTCRLDELEVSRPPLPQILIKLYSGVVITADKEHGLRAWSTKSPKKQLTELPFPKDDDTPTALYLTKGSSSTTSSSIEITVGFDDGHFSVYNLDVAQREFTIRFSQKSTTDGTITAIASAPPYLLTISDHKNFNLYKIPPHVAQHEEPSPPDQLRLLASLESNNTFAPMSLSLRCSASGVIASIAYSFFHLSNGWTIGIQELRFNRDGEHITSRLATTVAVQPKAGDTGLNGHPIDSSGKPNTNTRGFANLVSTDSIQHKEAPTSLSYSHPFLLTSHSDNTLTMYLVFSSADKLVIRDSRRLWGHTSSVSSVQVGDRGKAVSVSPRGNEIRIWELESAISSSSSFGSFSSPLSSRSRSMKGESSVQIHYEQPSSTPSFSLNTTSGAKDWGRRVSYQRDLDEISPPSTRDVDGWVGFDEEQVVVLRQRGLRAQFLECYDFT